VHNVCCTCTRQDAGLLRFSLWIVFWSEAVFVVCVCARSSTFINDDGAFHARSCADARLQHFSEASESKIA
jgi:hypothetical protein